MQSMNVCFCQKYEIQVNPGKLNFNYSMLIDTIPPLLTVFSPKPNIISDRPVYIKEPQIQIIGEVRDDKKLVSFKINDKEYINRNSDKFNCTIDLLKGMNKIELTASDKKGNVTRKEINVFSDPKLNLTPPIVKIDEPFISRGINVVELTDSKSDTLLVKGHIGDNRNIYSLMINEKIVSIIDSGKFYIVFKNRPKSLDIKAIDSLGNITQLSYKVDIADLSDIPDSLRGTNHALIIAVQDYQNSKISSIQGPLADGTNLKTILSEKYDFKPENVMMLENPTRKEILDSFISLRESIKPVDNLIIFYAGHGYFDQKIKQGYWLPADADDKNSSGWISNSDIRDQINGIDGRHVLLVADACFGGAIFKSRSAFSEAPNSILKAYSTKSRKALTSGLVELVPEKSKFMSHLLAILRSNESNYLLSSSIFWEIKQQSIQENGLTPGWGVIEGTGDDDLQGGEFVFVKKNTINNK